MTNVHEYRIPTDGNKSPWMTTYTDGVKVVIISDGRAEMNYLQVESYAHHLLRLAKELRR